MKTMFSLILSILFVIFTLVSNTFAQDYTTWGLPDGAKARLGKGFIRDVAYSPVSSLLAVGGGIGIWIYDADTGEELKLLTGDSDPVSVNSVSFSPDGQTLASGSLDTVLLWDVSSGGHLRTLTGHTDLVWSVSFSPDGETLASGSYDRTVRIWDVSSGGHLRTLTGHAYSVNSVSFSPEGQTLASGSWDGTVLLWDLASISTSKPTQFPEDVNKDGVVNIIDLTFVASNFGKQGNNDADVNGDGVVNIVDLTLVAAAFGNSTSAPLLLGHDSKIAPIRADVEAWLRDARKTNLTDPAFRRGILVLEQLLAALAPKETILLPNYPNPFNPETWIPYQLAKSADVSISIYTADGQLVRKLDLGHHAIGIYESQNRAAYWDGKNALGEPVASGVYFYTLTAGEFTATRKMLIRK